MDSVHGAVTAFAYLGADGLLRHPGLLPGWNFDCRADHGGTPTHRRSSRHRPDLVWHFPGVRHRDGANHPAHWLQSFRAVGHDPQRTPLSGQGVVADVPADDRGRHDHLYGARDRHLAAEQYEDVNGWRQQQWGQVLQDLTPFTLRVLPAAEFRAGTGPPIADRG